METTEQEVTFDGTIESALTGLLKPEEPEVEEVAAEADTEEAEEESEVEEVEASDDSEEDVEEEYEDAEEAEDEAPELFTVKVDGTEEQVSLEDLKRGYSGQKYVQKGMQDAAQLKKQAEEVFHALMGERQKIAEAYQMAVSDSGLPRPPKEPNREQFESDPIGFMEAKLKYDEDKAEYDGKMAEFQQLAEQQSQATVQAQRAYLEREMETLKTLVPEFADPDQASQARDRLVTMGQEIYGYEPGEIAAVMDHRAIRVLHDAIKYQELKSGKQQAERKAKPKAKRVVKAGAKKTASNAQATKQTRSKLRRSGRVEDALDLILKQ